MPVATLNEHDVARTRPERLALAHLPLQLSLEHHPPLVKVRVPVRVVGDAGHRVDEVDPVSLVQQHNFAPVGVGPVPFQHPLVGCVNQVGRFGLRKGEEFRWLDAFNIVVAPLRTDHKPHVPRTGTRRSDVVTITAGSDHHVSPFGLERLVLADLVLGLAVQHDPELIKVRVHVRVRRRARRSRNQQRAIAPITREKLPPPLVAGVRCAQIGEMCNGLVNCRGRCDHHAMYLLWRTGPASGGRSIHLKSCRFRRTSQAPMCHRWSGYEATGGSPAASARPACVRADHPARLRDAP